MLHVLQVQIKKIFIYNAKKFEVEKLDYILLDSYKENEAFHSKSGHDILW